MTLVRDHPSLKLTLFFPFYSQTLFFIIPLNEVMTKDQISSNTISALFLGCFQERCSTALYRGVPRTKFYVHTLHQVLYIKTIKSLTKQNDEWL